MSRATLSRRLLTVGLHFQQVKDDVRRDYAISRLQSTSDSLAKIGYDLGYSEPSAFQRAFKSWTGVAPGQFRKQERC